MSKSRASIFDEADEVKEIDVTSFAPKTAIDATAPPAEQVRVVAQAAKYRSREGTAPKHEPETKTKRLHRQHRTGRNVQFNVKAKLETVNAIYAITEAHPGWVLGFTLERAVAALQRELESEA